MKSHAFPVVLFLSAASLPAQTLFVPMGTSGIGSSGTSHVGVGTSSPGAKLEIYAPVAEAVRVRGDQSYLAFFDTAGNRQGYVQGSGGNVIVASDSGVVAVNAGGSERMRVLSNGNVGIGTTAPLSKLEVSGGGAALSATAAYNFISTQDHGAYRGVYLGFDGSGQIGVVGAGSGGAVSQLAFWAHNGAGNLELARLAGNGNFGVGTTAPGARLHTHGGSDGTNFYFTTTGATAGWNGGAYSDNSFRINHAGVAARFVIDGSGNVGIGTTSPTHRLSINGTIRAKEVIVDTGWADHVFAADYRLAPLSEVEQHVQQNGHLPDVPSAADVAERGVSVGEMQKILLRKIEELTLHVIRLEKENASLRADMTVFKTQSSHRN